MRYFLHRIKIINGKFVESVLYEFCIWLMLIPNNQIEPMVISMYTQNVPHRVYTVLVFAGVRMLFDVRIATKCNATAVLYVYALGESAATYFY